MWKTATLLTAIVMVLLAIGIVILASTSGIQSEEHYGNSYHFLTRQVVAMILGAVAAVAASRFPYIHWKKLAVFMGVVSVIMLVMTLTPGVGIKVGGSHRWLRFGPLNVQPSEFAKFSMIVLVSMWASVMQRRIKTFWKGAVAPLAVIGLFCVLILAEPDYGSTILVGAVGLLILFLAGTRISYLSVATISGMSLMVIMIMNNELRLRRIMAFMNPEKYYERESYQLVQALFAFVSAGARGTGLGEGLQKRYYLPEAHTDFIFAILGEELGIVASIGVLLLYFGLFLCGVWISMNAKDMFGRLLAFGITAMIALQAAANIAVVTGCMPTKGLPLPLISYGGTNLAVNLMMIGVLINIALENARSSSSGKVDAVRDRFHSL